MAQKGIGDDGRKGGGREVEGEGRRGGREREGGGKGQSRREVDYGNQRVKGCLLKGIHELNVNQSTFAAGYYSFLIFIFKNF